MSRSVRDARLSLSRYVAGTLTEFDAHLVRGEQEYERPFFVVRSVGDANPEPANQRITDVIRPFFVYVYPPTGKNPQVAQDVADEVEERLTALFTAGDGRTGWPSRIPLYDYAGIELDDPKVPAEPEGFMTLRRGGFTIRTQPDDTDERRWSLTASLRLAWRRVGNVPSGPPVTAVQIGQRRVT